MADPIRRIEEVRADSLQRMRQALSEAYMAGYGEGTIGGARAAVEAVNAVLDAQEAYGHVVISTNTVRQALKGIEQAVTPKDKK